MLWDQVSGVNGRQCALLLRNESGFDVRYNCEQVQQWTLCSVPGYPQTTQHNVPGILFLCNALGSWVRIST